MEKQVIILLIFFFVLIGGRLLARNSGEWSSSCQQIEQACGKAGYVRGLTNDGDGKDLDKACMQPILKGQSVEGVQVDSDTAQKCKSQLQAKPTISKKHKRKF